MTDLLKDQVILVTGASSGIGAETARRLAKHGAFVIINYLKNHEQAKKVEEDCNQTTYGGGWCIAADMTDAAAIGQMVEDIRLEFGRLDGIVFNAAFSYKFDAQNRPYPWHIDWDEYAEAQKQIVAPLHALLNLTLDMLTKKEDSRVVVVSSNLVKRPIVTYHTYNVGKAALEAYGRNMANELGRMGVRINTVAPGMVYPTKATAETKEETKELVIAQTPLGRLAKAEDVADAVLFFLSPYSSFLTGQSLYVDGGLTNQ